MKNIKVEIAELISAKIAEISQGAAQLSPEETEKLIEIPGDSSLGDYAFPCFRLAKALRKAPAMIAADLAASWRGAASSKRSRASTPM